MADRANRPTGENAAGISSQLRALTLERDQLVTKLEQLRDEAAHLRDKPNHTDGDDERFRRIEKGVANAEGKLARLDAREASLGNLWEEEIRAGIDSGLFTVTHGADTGAASPSRFDRDPARDRADIYQPRRADPWAGLEAGSPLRLLGPDEARSRAYDAIVYASGTTDDARKRLTEIVERFDNPTGDLARQVLHTTHPDYVAAFFAYVRGESDFLTDAEIRAVRRVREVQRAMSLTDAAGGFLVPAQLDPSIINTGDGSASGIQQAARQVVATGDTWTGVSAGQISASFDAEASEVSDDSPTLAQPSVPIHTSRIFVPFSIEVGMDGANFTAEVTSLMADAQRNLENSVLATGTGSGEPTGIVTALTGTASEVASITTDTFALADVYGLYDALPRYKDNGSWLANDAVYTLIRQFDTSGGSALWAQLGTGNPDRLIGRPAYSNSTMDGTVTAAAENYLLIFGDLTNYVLARRLGFTIELVQHLFATANNRPSGQRGLFGYARLGADSVNDNGMRMLNVT